MSPNNLISSSLTRSPWAVLNAERDVTITPGLTKWAVMDGDATSYSLFPWRAPPHVPWATNYCVPVWLSLFFSHSGPNCALQTASPPNPVGISLALDLGSASLCSLDLFIDCVWTLDWVKPISFSMRRSRNAAKKVSKSHRLAKSLRLEPLES